MPKLRLEPIYLFSPLLFQPMINSLSTRRLSWVLLLLFPFLFSECGKKSTDVVPTSAALQGSWRLTAYTIDPAYDLLGDGKKTNDLLAALGSFAGQQFVTCFKAVTLTFNANGKVTSTTTPACTNTNASPVDNGATWALTGSKLKITEGTDVNEFDVSISGNTLRLSQPDTDDYDNDGKKETVTLSLVLTKA